MKKYLCAIVALVMALGLTACGGSDGAAWTCENGQSIADSQAFSDELDELDLDTACAVYGLDREQVTDGFVRRSAGATCEEVAVLIFDSKEHAAGGLTQLKSYLESQIESNQDYRPAEVPKLNKAWLEQGENTVLLVVANDMSAAQSAIG